MFPRIKSVIQVWNVMKVNDDRILFLAEIKLVNYPLNLLFLMKMLK